MKDIVWSDFNSFKCTCFLEIAAGIVNRRKLRRNSGLEMIHFPFERNKLENYMKPQIHHTKNKKKITTNYMKPQKTTTNSSFQWKFIVFNLFNTYNKHMRSSTKMALI